MRICDANPREKSEREASWIYVREQFLWASHRPSEFDVNVLWAAFMTTDLYYGEQEKSVEKIGVFPIGTIWICREIPIMKLRDIEPKSLADLDADVTVTMHEQLKRGEWHSWLWIESSTKIQWRTNLSRIDFTYGTVYVCMEHPV